MANKSALEALSAKIKQSSKQGYVKRKKPAKKPVLLVIKEKIKS